MEPQDYFGFCTICGQSGQFSGDGLPSVRESFKCPTCKSALRWRDQAAVVLDEFGRGQALSLLDLVKSGSLDDLHIFEATPQGPFVQAFSKLPHYVNGRFQPAPKENDDARPKSDVLAFPDESFDLVLSSDVVEHLPDIEAALAEFLRVLKIGGVHVFTVASAFPFPDHSHTQVSAAEGLSSGTTKAVNTDFGADIVDLVECLGGQLSIVRRSDAVDACRSNATFVMRRVDGVLRDRASRPRPVLKHGQRPPQPVQKVAAGEQVVSKAAAEIAKQFVCPVCGGGKLLAFNGRENARCAGCGSVERNRLTFMFLESRKVFRAGVRVLHMAPEGEIGRKFSELPLCLYDARDLDPSRYKSAHFQVHKIDLCSDLSAIPDDSYDVILHSHVLEHLPCDVEQVLLEMDRILAPGGMHFFSVPIRGAKTNEDLSPDLTPAQRRERFGQEDHMRIFGRDDLKALLERIWGPGEHVLNPVREFGHERLRRAAIPIQAWSGMSSHSVFFNGKQKPRVFGPISTLVPRGEGGAKGPMEVFQTVSPIGNGDMGTQRRVFCEWVLNDLIPAKRGDRLIDLGAGHLAFSRVAKVAGYDVLAVDGRTERLPDNMHGIAFEQRDIRDASLAGQDVVLALGIFYHLELEDQLRLLRSVPDHARLVLDTQVHNPAVVDPQSNAAKGFFADNPVELDGYSGVMFPENDAATASIGNATSFWPTEESQLQMLADTGFTQAILLGEQYMVKYGARRWIVASKSNPLSIRAVNLALGRHAAGA